MRYAQPRHGFRSGIEPVLLAASIPATPGARVLEGGSGAGAALLCLAARVPAVEGVGIELDPALVALARQNAASNGWPNLCFRTGDIAELTAQAEFDHACANPPYHTADGTPSPDARRQVAKRGSLGLLREWATALGATLRQRGTLTFIIPSSLLPEALEAFAAARCSPFAALPLWPRAGHPAKLLILRGVRDSHAPFRMLPGLTLHTSQGSFTAETDAVLRHGAALPL